MRRVWFLVLSVVIGTSAGCAQPRPQTSPPVSSTTVLRISDAFSIAPMTSFPSLDGLRFGGVSGLAYDPARGELFGICDDQVKSRYFRLRVLERPFRVEPVEAIGLDTTGGAPQTLDPEAIALLPDGDILIASEGIGSRQPRLPPALVEYTREGRFIRQLPVRSRFVPTPSGPLANGVRDNQAFESLALTADASRLYTATETTLVQDGPPPSFDSPALGRILEYTKEGESYVPAREFAYPLDTIPTPPFPAGFSINGVADLLALEDGELLAIERAFVEDRQHPGHGLNRIRLYRVSLDGATDVSGIDSLATHLVFPVARKTLVADLASARGLPRSLAGLDNFEGITALPSSPGSLRLLLVSDDNFSRTQRTWFVRATLRNETTTPAAR